jgi:uncharacterized membrane protein
MEHLTVWIEAIGAGIELVGVVVIVAGLIFGGLRAIRARVNGQNDYQVFREVFGRTLLLGLEILVAADIIKSVALTPSLESVAVLGLLVVIRTFLGWALIVELEGRWPWQPARAQPEAEARPAPRPSGEAL